MNAQATPSPYTPAGGSNMTIGNPPVLGSQVPGTTGGLPALGGLSVMQNPMAPELQSMQPQQSAQHAQQFGRGEDTMLVHMTPAEVNSLQGLAMASGGSLTINPHTGLPEAGWLGKLLPTLLGFGLNFIPGIGPLAAAGITAAGATAVTGDLKKGLMAGLQAYGGAGLSGALAPGATAGAAAKLGTEAAAKMAAEKAAVTAAQQGVTAAGTDVAAKAVAQKALDEALKNQVTKMPGVLSRFGAETSLGAKGLIGKALPMIAGTAVVGGVSDAMQPKLPTYKPEQTKPYVRMAPAKREVRYPTPEELQQMGSAEFNYFTPSNPEPVPADTSAYGSGYGFADGGAVGSNAGLDALIASYQAQNPGAITASMQPNPLPAYVKPATTTPTAAPATGSTGLGSYTATPSQVGGETQYNFSRKPMGSGSTYGSNVGGFGNFGGFNLSNLAGMDFSQFAPQMQTAAPIYDSGNYEFDNYGAGQFIPQTQAQPTTPQIPDYSGMDFSGMDFSQYTPTAPEVQVPAADYSAPQLPDFSGMDFSQFAPQAETATPTDNNSITGPNTEYAQAYPALYASRNDPIGVFNPEGKYSGMGMPSPFGTTSSWSPPTGTPNTLVHASGAPLTQDEMDQYYRSAQASSDASGGYVQPAAPQPTPSYADSPYFSPTPAAPSYDYSQLDQIRSMFAPQYESGPAIYDMNADQYQTVGGFAGGGDVNMGNGSFVVDARTVSELGNGSSNAGMELLSRLGGKPVRGPGDGVSDSVKASIGGTQPARVARDEVIFPPEAVRRMGGGNEKRGTQKLYALMDKAHKARKKAKRGQDTGLRKGLA